MNFLADERVDRQIVEQLRRDGHRVGYVAEMTPGIPDATVLAAANPEAALLLTADKDFGEMLFRQRLHAHGVVLIRLAGLAPGRKAELVASAVNQHAADLRRAFTVVAPSAIRIRHLDG